MEATARRMGTLLAKSGEASAVNVQAIGSRSRGEPGFPDFHRPSQVEYLGVDEVISHAESLAIGLTYPAFRAAHTI